MIQIFFIALFTIVGQFFFAKAFTMAPGDKVNTWIYISLVFAAIIGYVLWEEPIVAATVTGAVLIVGGAYLATRERSASKAQLN